MVRSEDATTSSTGPYNGGNADTNTIKLSAAPGGTTTTAFSDGFESGIGNWTISSYGALGTVYAHTGTYSAWSDAADNIACATTRKSTLVAIPSGAINPLLHFWTRYAIE